MGFKVREAESRALPTQLELNQRVQRPRKAKTASRQWHPEATVHQLKQAYLGNITHPMLKAITQNRMIIIPIFRWRN